MFLGETAAAKGAARRWCPAICSDLPMAHSPAHPRSHGEQIKRDALRRICPGGGGARDRSAQAGTVALDIVRRPKATPVHELECYMRCKDCWEVRGYAYKPSGGAAINQDFSQ